MPLTDPLAELGIDDATLVADDSGTIVVGERSTPDQSAAGLPILTVGPADERVPAGRDLELQETIGSGGMATVWSAKQPSLERRVAVKELRSERRSDKARNELLREARVAGALEHPNIVPIHTLGLTEDGWPVIVMKFIEGRPWKQSLAPICGEPAPASELIEEQLRIFMQVCTAVDFAHDRGVIHRDLKPDNVMIGAFEEVYVVDWGLALQLGPEGHARAEDVPGVAGTPGYMAPEMVAAKAEGIGRWTDVYLLGAILHELVTGSRPHRGATVTATVLAAHASKPPRYPESVPVELAEICRRAMHRQADRRYPSAAALRSAVADFIRHRSAVMLADEAQARYLRLRDEADLDPLVHNELASEARFGFRQALRQWPENGRAREGLIALLELLVEHELVDENLRAVESALAELGELGEARPALERRLEQARERLAARERDVADLAELRRDASLGVNVALRRRLAVINALVLAGGASLLFALRALGIYEVGYLAVIAFSLLLTGVVAVGGWILDRQEGNRANRQVIGSIAVGCAAAALVFAVAWIAGMDIVAAEAMAMLAAATSAGVLAWTLDRGLIWTSVAFVFGALAVVAWPELRGVWVAVFGGAGFAVGSVVWRKLANDARDRGS